MFDNNTLWGDIRYAVRIMCRAPLFTATVVLTVTLAIAANATIFTVVNAVMIRSLPFAEPNRIMQVAEKNDKLNLPTFSASVLNFLSWREQTRSLAVQGRAPAVPGPAPRPGRNQPCPCGSGKKFKRCCISIR